MSGPIDWLKNIDLSPIRRCFSTRELTPPSGKFAVFRDCESSDLCEEITEATTPDIDNKIIYTRDKFTLRKELRIVKLHEIKGT